MVLPERGSPWRPILLVAGAVVGGVFGLAVVFPLVATFLPYLTGIPETIVEVIAFGRR